MGHSAHRCKLTYGDCYGICNKAGGWSKGTALPASVHRVPAGVLVRRGRGPGAGVVLRETVQAEGSSGEAKGEEGGTETAGEVRLTVGESPWGTMGHGENPMGRHSASPRGDMGQAPRGRVGRVG